MTINTQIASQTFPGNSVASVFPCVFRIFDDTDVDVSLVNPANGSSTPLVLNSDYTIDGAGDQSGFTLTTMTAVATGTNLYVKRNIAYTQPTDFTNQGAFFPTMHEDMADRLAMQIQQLLDLSDRSVSIPGGILPAPSPMLPIPQGGSLLGWAADGSALVNTGASGVGAGSIADVNVASSAGINASKLSFKQSGTGAQARAVLERLQETVHVTDFMTTAQKSDVAARTRAQDVTAAIQSAVAACQGRRLYFPPGDYLISAAINIVVSGITMVCERGQVNIVLGTLNQNGFVVGDGTLTTRGLAFNVVIDGFTFSPKNGLANFTTGSCIYLNYTFFQTIQNCDFYGADTGNTNRLFNAVTISQATTFYFKKCQIRHFRNYGTQIVGGATLPLRTVDGYLDEIEYTDCGNDCLLIGTGCAGLVANKITAQTYSTWGIHIQTNPTGPNGQNIFLMQPDLEADGTSGGIWLEYAANVNIIGGWIGATVANKAILFDTNASTCRVIGMNIIGTVSFVGLANTVSDCDITGDNATHTTGILVATGAAGSAILGCRIRQFITSGIALSGSPQQVQINNNQFANVPIEVTGQGGFAGGPVIRGNMSTASSTLTAAASITLRVGLDTYQVTGATTVTTMTQLGRGSRVTIQAGTGGITVSSGGNLQLKTAPTTIPQFNTMSFVSDGINWFEDGRNF